MDRYTGQTPVQGNIPHVAGQGHPFGGRTPGQTRYPDQYLVTNSRRTSYFRSARYPPFVMILSPPDTSPKGGRHRGNARETTRNGQTLETLAGTTETLFSELSGPA
jgi:hypothetical protein